MILHNWLHRSFFFNNFIIFEKFLFYLTIVDHLLKMELYIILIMIYTAIKHAKSVVQRQKLGVRFCKEIKKVTSESELIGKLEEIDLPHKPSIFLSEEEEKIKHRILTKEQKQQLGLYIPKPKFAPRLTKTNEGAYRPDICENLYDLQASNLVPSIQILQLKHSNNPSLQIDQYINHLYKDIFARFIIAKGIGIEWESSFARYGVMNPSAKDNYYQLKTQFYSWLLHLLSVFEVEIKPTLGLYSYGTKQYISLKNIDVENIQKIGIFTKVPLKEFGNYSKEFQVLKKKGAVINLLVFAEDMLKLISPQAICVEPEQKMVILLHQETQQYLITCMHVYSEYKSYFKKNQYMKHQLVESKFLANMKTESLQLKMEVEGYSRKYGLHFVDAFSNLPDFQRVEIYGIRLPPSYFDQSGNILINGEIVTHATDPFYEEKIKQKLEKIQFTELFAPYEDQIYSWKDERVHFRTGQRFIFPIPESNYQRLHQQMEKSVVTQSKISIPYGQKFEKPRERRRHRKYIKKLRDQMTSYMSLGEAIQSINQLAISTLQSSSYKVPVLVKDGKVEPMAAKTIQEVQKYQNSEGIWDQIGVSKVLIGLEGQVRWIAVNEKLWQGFMCVKNYKKKMNSVLIEPQSQTEQNLPYILHLYCLLNTPRSSFRKKQLTQKSPSLFKLLKLHPTINESQREKSVNALIFGSVKANDQEQYGFGLEALRLWTCANDYYLGDRFIKESQINQHLEKSAFIRKLYWEIVPLIQSTKDIPYEQLTYLDRFMLDHINYYILNMQQAYSNLELERAYQLTTNFFKHYVEEIFVKTVRRRMITYPELPANQGHNVVLQRIIELLGVISPILPFSAYHISKSEYMVWPKVEHVRYNLIPTYNRMTKLRVEVRNKLLLNRFHHAELVITQDPDLMNLTPQDLELFLDVSKVRLEPPEEKKRGFHLKLKQNHPIGDIPKIQFYQYKDVCIRCSPNKYYDNHICGTCFSYLKDTLIE